MFQVHEKVAECIAKAGADPEHARQAAETLVFADEPTSGLDAFQAERMMVVLGALAREGRTVAPRNELRARAPRQDSSVVLNVPRACPRFGRRWS